MHNLQSEKPTGISEEQKQSTHRLLRRLRLALLIWLLCFIGTAIWFSYCW